MSASFTTDGAFDGLAHSLEVYYGATPSSLEKIQEIALTGIELIIASLKNAYGNASDMEAREALGLATDLGGYAIMMGGTNGAHLTSFSLVDILSHGRACALLNPYYTVFFAPSIPKQLQKLSHLFAQYGLTDKTSSTPKSQDLGLTVAKALIKLSESVGFPTTLEEIEGMSHAYIEKSLQSAKNPQLEIKLKNMPIPLTSNRVDEYMRPVLEAALTGNFSLIKTISK
jgi:alcohol dehydrogenase